MRKRYNDLARDNSTIFIPGGFHKEKEHKLKDSHDDEVRDDNKEPIDIDCNPETAGGAQAGPAIQEQRKKRSNRGTANEDDDFVMKELNSLLLDRSIREGHFEAKVVSERVKAQAGERKARLREETKQAERLWKMAELERREEKERADRWKDQRLAQLEREKEVAENELAREKVARKQSKLQRVFKEQQQRNKDEERWKWMMGRDAKLAAERESNLLRENVMLGNNLRSVDNAFRRACNERDHVKKEKEEERTRRIRAEESLCRWKELMKEYFPGGQQQQDPDQQQEQPQQQPPPPRRPPSLKAQFQLYEEKWQVLRSGFEIDGSKIHLISFSQIPWPVVSMSPTDPSQILPEHVRKFVMHPLRNLPDRTGRRKTRKMMAAAELKKWHPDKFRTIVLSKVREEDKEAASEVAEMIARCLTDALG